MILFSPPIQLPETIDDHADFLEKVESFQANTISTSTPAEWTDQDAENSRKFLDSNDIRVGEFSTFHWGFDHQDASERSAALEHYKRMIRHGVIMGAHCVGFSTYGDRGMPGMWSDSTWTRCLDAITRIAEEAENAKIDIAAHPHAMAPLCSVDRYVEMLTHVDSARLKVLIDIVNLTWPQRIFNTTDLVNEVFDSLGHAIVALHAKDVIISGGSGVSAAKGMGVIHVDEAVPGTGFMDFETILNRLDMLKQDITINVEHFDYNDTREGQSYIQGIADRSGITFK